MESRVDALIAAKWGLCSLSKCSADKGKLSRGMLIASGTVPFSHGLTLISKWLLKSNSVPEGRLGLCRAEVGPHFPGLPGQWGPTLIPTSF